MSLFGFRMMSHTTLKMLIERSDRCIDWVHQMSAFNVVSSLAIGWGIRTNIIKLSTVFLVMDPRKKSSPSICLVSVNYPNIVNIPLYGNTHIELGSEYVFQDSTGLAVTWFAQYICLSTLDIHWMLLFFITKVSRFYK